MNLNVISAIFRRNLVSYFSNPTGYVFICVFVLLGSFAAFWPNEFFSDNLANLNQLNKYLPYILLVFIPAITMSIWADEKRQGTDELLLTIPATDFDVVLGKYLAAVGIYTVSLVFSAMCNFTVLVWLSRSPEHWLGLDTGLFSATYFGYWMVGLAMLAIGMAASFLTGNLTVGFVLGVVFNVPLVFAADAESLALPTWVVTHWPILPHFVKHLSLAEQFRDYGRGMITFSSIVYFLSLAAAALYLSMVFIGRRHWSGGRDGESMGWHFLGRVIALFVVVVSANLFLSHHDRVRFDASTERMNSLSSETRELIAKIDSKRPVHVEAFLSVSRDFPEDYVATRLNLLAMLHEFRALGENKINVVIHDQMEPFTEEATRAEEQFGITPRAARTRKPRGRGDEGIFLGVAVTCGLEKVVVPFFDRGLPVEYELVRSICTVSQQQRKKIGVLQTDAKLFGGFDPSSMRPTPNQLLIDELQKQYEVSQVDASNPITERYDVLLAVQPSSLNPQQMDNFVAAVAAGQPTAVFEDPLPLFMQDTPGTNAPKQPPGGPMAMFNRQPPQPKGDITRLWKLLGVDFMSTNIVWDDFNPYPKLVPFGITREWVFIDPQGGEADAFDESSKITKGLHQVLLIYPGSVTALNNTPMTITALMKTNKKTGTIAIDKIIERNFMGQPAFVPRREQFYKPTHQSYVMGAFIHGPIGAANQPMSDKGADEKDADDKNTAEKAADEPASDKAPAGEMPAGESRANEKSAAAPAVDAPADEKSDAGKGADKTEADKTKADKAPPKPTEIRVVLVPDIDCLFSGIFAVRAHGSSDDDDDIDLHLQNVTFVLNALDVLADDDRFVAIRGREPVHHTLVGVSAATEYAKEEAETARQTKSAEFEKSTAALQQEIDKITADAKKNGGAGNPEVMTNWMIKVNEIERRNKILLERTRQELDHDLKTIEHKRLQDVRATQDWYKMWAVLLPPIPPLLLAFFVFFNRRAQEREGVSKARLR